MYETAQINIWAIKYKVINRSPHMPGWIAIKTEHNWIIVAFFCSQFENNTSVGTTVEHSSALVAFRFPVEFQGHNHFYGNRGGGITLLNTILTAKGTLLFESNSATFGGGLAMDDRCLVRKFINKALCVHDIIYTSSICVIDDGFLMLSQ